MRRIDTLTKLYKYFSDKEKNININTEINKKKSCWAIIFSLNILIVLLTDFIIPIAFVYEYNEDFINDDEYEKEESVASLVIGVLFMVICSVLTCSYTIIIVYSTTRRRYITGDFLSGYSVNDNISLMKTVQLVCGYSFALVYCNLYFWKAIDKMGDLGKPKFYEEIVIPDYTFKSGISIYMILKIIIIVGSMIATLKFNKVFVFTNDLADYNLGHNNNMLDNDIEFKKFLAENKKIINFFNK